MTLNHSLSISRMMRCMVFHSAWCPSKLLGMLLCIACFSLCQVVEPCQLAEAVADGAVEVQIAIAVEVQVEGMCT